MVAKKIISRGFPYPRYTDVEIGLNFSNQFDVSIPTVGIERNLNPNHVEYNRVDW